jgi:hypothetical protein
MSYIPDLKKRKVVSTVIQAKETPESFLNEYKARKMIRESAVDRVE